MDDVTAAHVVKEKGLIVQPLTLEQAIIVQGYTGLGFVAPELMGKDHHERGVADDPLKHLAYMEDFKRLAPYQDEMANYPALTEMLQDIIVNKMYADPFSQWDSRVDILVEGHINHKTQAALRVSSYLVDSTIEFTDRPGTSKQTWIVIHRPDPTEYNMQHAVAAFEELYQDEPDANELKMPFHLPDRVGQEFCYHARQITGASISYRHERFHRDEAIICITR
jgi:hypothetical protein